MFIGELPELAGQNPIVKGVAGGWQVSGIVTARSGNPLTITQASGIVNSRPDIVPGVPLVIDNWKDTCDATGCNYLNPAAFVRVPVIAATNATTRPGTYIFGDARSPAEWDMNMTLCKELRCWRGTKIAGPGRFLQLAE